MRMVLMAALLAGVFLCGCGATGGGGAGSRSGDAANLPAQPQSGANMFNPYMRESLPNLRAATLDNQRMLAQLGGDVPRIEGEAAHRPHWRQELYPVVFGDARAPHEIMVLLDFAAPQSEKVWQAVAEAGRSLPPQQCKIVVFANSKEYYGTDLMGLAIWISYSRPGQTMPYLSYALSGWNAVKAGQKRAHGRAVAFNNEYDATVSGTDYPLHYAYFSRLRPPVPAAEELKVAQYC